jgi:hypothetical protein
LDGAQGAGLLRVSFDWRLARRCHGRRAAASRSRTGPSTTCPAATEIVADAVLEDDREQACRNCPRADQSPCSPGIDAGAIRFTGDSGALFQSLRGGARRVRPDVQRRRGLIGVAITHGVHEAPSEP